MTPQADLTPVLPLTILVVWACVLLIVDLFIPKDRKGITALLSAIGLGITFIFTLMQIGAEPLNSFNNMVVSDGFSTFVNALLLLSGLLGIGLSFGYIKRMNLERGEYYTLMLFSISGMMLMAQAGDLIVVFLALELLSIPLYVLAAFDRPKVESEEAGLKYFLLGAFATGFVVYGTALVFGATGTTSLSGIVSFLGSGGTPGLLLTIGAALILVGLGFKIAAVPFHMWTPDVYQGSPTAVTAFMAAGAKIAGYILMAFVPYGNPEVASVSVAAGLFYLVSYAITNFGTWGVVIALEKAEGRGLEIKDYAGLGKKYPALAAAMTIFMLSLIGLPPTLGLVGKFYLFRAVMAGGFTGLALIGVLTSLISAYYYLRVVVTMYMQEGDPERSREAFLDFTTALTAIATVVVSLVPQYLFTWASNAVLKLF
jgi:NADH-quinone oxidoreductase subunit N